MRSSLKHRACALAAAACVAAAGAAGCNQSEPVSGPVIGVLSYAPDRIVLVDPVALSVVGEVPLRSMGVDLTALSEPRGFATAQCGGVGSSADDAVAVVDLDDPPVARYVDLQSPNPGSVEILPGGALAVGHGLVVPDGSVCSLVDPVDRVLVAERTLGNVAGSPVAAAGFLWTAGAEADDLASADVTLRRTSIDLATSVVVDRPGPGGCLVAADPCGADSLLRVTSGGGEATVERLDAASLTPTASVRLTGLSDRISSVTAAGAYLVLVDATGEDVSDPGGPLIVLDAVSLAEAGRVDAGGSISEVTALDGLLYAVTWSTGELLEIDPVAGEVLRRMTIPDADGRMLEVAAVP